jgi:4-amino-4-deoxy-L-arabinose transferase-like glycosyltransferase
MNRRVQLAALVAGVLLLYGAGLTYSPPYLHEAELLFGLHAHAIATTGHDVYGRLLPLYFQMTPIGENVWFHPAIVYATAPFLLVLPVAEWVIRLPSILVAALNVVLLYQVAVRAFRDQRLAWLAAGLLAITPSHYINSRIAMDYVYPLPFVLGWTLCLLIYLERRSPRILFLGGTLLGIGVYSYIASVVMMPIYLAFTWLMLYLHTERPLRASVLATIGFAWPLLMLPVWLYYHPAVLQETLGRYGVVNAELANNFRGKPLAEILAELRAPLRFSGLTGRVSLYWYFFDPSFLFLSGGYANVVNSTRHVGVFLLPFLALLPLGFWRLIKAWREPVNTLLLFGFVTAPVAACLVVPEPYAIDREMPVVPFGVLIATVGIGWLLSGAQRWQRIAAVSALVLGVAHFAFFLGDYYLDYRGRAAFWFNHNHRAALERIVAQDNQSHAPAIYLTSAKDPYIAAYWEFALIKTGRRDLLERTVYFDGATLDVATVPAGSLMLINVDDRRLAEQAASGQLRKLAEIPEPADPVFFTVLQRP